MIHTNFNIKQWCRVPRGIRYFASSRKFSHFLNGVSVLYVYTVWTCPFHYCCLEEYYPGNFWKDEKPFSLILKIHLHCCSCKYLSDKPLTRAFGNIMHRNTYIRKRKVQPVGDKINYRMKSGWVCFRKNMEGEFPNKLPSEQKLGASALGCSDQEKYLLSWNPNLLNRTAVTLEEYGLM